MKLNLWIFTVSFNTQNTKKKCGIQSFNSVTRTVEISLNRIIFRSEYYLNRIICMVPFFPYTKVVNCMTLLCAEESKSLLLTFMELTQKNVMLFFSEMWF